MVLGAGPALDADSFGHFVYAACCFGHADRLRAGPVRHTQVSDLRKDVIPCQEGTHASTPAVGQRYGILSVPPAAQLPRPRKQNVLLGQGTSKPCGAMGAWGLWTWCRCGRGVRV